MNPDANYSIGNIASFDVKDAEYNFAGNVFLSKRSILGLKAKGGILDGVSSIFNNNKFNSKFGGSIQINILGESGNNSIDYLGEEFTKYEDNLFKVETQLLIDSIEFVNKKSILIKQLEIEKLIKRQDSIKTVLKDNYIKKTESQAKVQLLKTDSMSLHLRIERLKEKLEIEKNKYDRPLNIKASNEKYNKYSDTLEKGLKNVKLLGFKLGWFTVNYTVLNNSFKEYNKDVQYSDQIGNKSFLNHELTFSYSYYNKSTLSASRFYNFGLNFSIEDNFNELTKKEITELMKSSDGKIERTSSLKYNAYEGEYLIDLFSGSLKGEMYQFINSNNRIALHLQAEYKFQEKRKPTINPGVGLLISFRKNDKDKSIVNAEIYANFIDAINNNDSENSFFLGADYGLRFSFPIIL